MQSHFHFDADLNSSSQEVVIKALAKKPKASGFQFLPLLLSLTPGKS